jgi:hypothetical protein
MRARPALAVDVVGAAAVVISAWQLLFLLPPHVCALARPPAVAAARTCALALLPLCICAPSLLLYMPCTRLSSL